MADKDVETAQAQVSEKKSKGMLKFILIPVIIIAQAVAAYFIVFNLILQNPDEQKNKQAGKNGKVGQFYELRDLVVNPAGTQGRRFLVLELGLESNNPQAVEEAKQKEIRIRDALISLLTKKTVEELLDITQQDKLKKEILRQINQLLYQSKFHNVYFNKFIIQ